MHATVQRGETERWRGGEVESTLLLVKYLRTFVSTTEDILYFGPVKSVEESPQDA